MNRLFVLPLLLTFSILQAFEHGDVPACADWDQPLPSYDVLRQYYEGWTGEMLPSIHVQQGPAAADFALDKRGSKRIKRILMPQQDIPVCCAQMYDKDAVQAQAEHRFFFHPDATDKQCFMCGRVMSKNGIRKHMQDHASKVPVLAPCNYGSASGEKCMKMFHCTTRGPERVHHCEAHKLHDDLILQGVVQKCIPVVDRVYSETYFKSLSIKAARRGYELTFMPDRLCCQLLQSQGDVKDGVPLQEHALLLHESAAQAPYCPTCKRKFTSIQRRIQRHCAACAVQSLRPCRYAKQCNCEWMFDDGNERDRRCQLHHEFAHQIDIACKKKDCGRDKDS